MKEDRIVNQFLFKLHSSSDNINISPLGTHLSHSQLTSEQDYMQKIMKKLVKTFDSHTPISPPAMAGFPSESS